MNYIDEGEDKDRRIRRLMEEVTQLRTKFTQMEGGGGVGGAGAAGGAGGGGAGKISANRLVSILGKLGVMAIVSADGGITVNGRTVKMDDLGLGAASGSMVEDGSVAASGGGGADDGGFSNKLKRMKIEEKLREQLAEMTENVDRLTLKCNTQKSTIETQTKKLKELSDQVLRLTTDVSHKDIEFNEVMEDRDRELNDMIASFNKKREEAVLEVIDHNTRIARQQISSLVGASSTFEKYTELLNKKKDEKEQFEKTMRKQFEKHLNKLEAARVEERGKLQLQYERWLREKDRSIEQVTEAFNVYRSKKAEQLRMCEKELVALYDYAEKLDFLLDDVEMGSFRVKQAQGMTGRKTTGMVPLLGNQQAEPETVGQAMIPKGARPVNPFVGQGRLFELTKKLVHRHRQREEKANNAREEAFYQSLQNAATQQADNLSTVDSVDTSLDQQLKDFIAPPPAHPKASKIAGSSSMGASASTMGRPRSGVWSHKGSLPVASASTSDGVAVGAMRPGSAGKLRMRARSANVRGSHENTSSGFGASASRGDGAALNTASVLSLTAGDGDESPVANVRHSKTSDTALLEEVESLRAELADLKEQRQYEKVFAI